jgi:tRNA(Ile)-lysidine synthase
MRPVSPVPGSPDLTLIRPLLSVPRAELIAYCRAEGILWRDDTTNSDIRYQRNWIRHEVLPLLRQANPGVTMALARLAKISAQEDDFLQTTIERYFDEHATVASSRVWLSREAFDGWHPALQKRALIYAQRLIDADSEPDFERIQVAALLAHSSEGGVAELGGGVQVEIDTGWLSVAASGAPWSPPFDGYWVSHHDGERAPRLTPTAREIHHLQLIKIRVPHDSVINVRSRRAGDRVFPRSLGGKSKKLKDWLINRKTPRQLRDHLPVIEAAGQIIAIWDGTQWETFSPPFPDDTIEISLTPDD